MDTDMDTIYGCCAGLDVHKETVEANVRRLDAEGRLHSEVRRFGTFTRDLLALADWMAAAGVTHVAMESTGVFWKPIFNLLEGRFEVLLVNARHVKNVPGRKTDVSDCQWLGRLLQHGLLRGSFVPNRELRELRDLTRHRSQMVAETTRVANRIHKVLEDANIKLGSVATDILGVSGRAMIADLIAGQQDPAVLAGHARGRLKKKTPELERALEGRVSEHHRFMLQLLWDELIQVEALIARLEARIEDQIAPFATAVELLDDIPGVDLHVAHTIIAEIGTDMSRFPSAGHLASWAGMCPGNNESAGKRKSGKTTKGSRWLRQGLVQAGWAASHTKDTYLSTQYARLARKRGRKRALVGVGHSILVSSYHMLKNGVCYEDLGPDYLDTLNQQRLTKSLVKRLEKIGYQVKLEPKVTAA